MEPGEHFIETSALAPHDLLSTKATKFVFLKQMRKCFSLYTAKSIILYFTENQEPNNLQNESLLRSLTHTVCVGRER